MTTQEQKTRRYVVNVNVTVEATDEDEAHRYVADSVLGVTWDEVAIVSVIAEDVDGGETGDDAR